MLDQSGWNMKLNKRRFIDMEGLSYDKKFNTLVMTLGDGVNILPGWLLEAWEKWWPAEWKVEMPELLRWTADEGIKISEKLAC